MGKILTETLFREKYKYKESAKKDVLYIQVLKMKALFIEFGLNESEIVEWRLICDYIKFKEGGCATKGQCHKMIQLLGQFGDESRVRQIWGETKRERELYTQRVLKACREIDKELKRRRENKLKWKRIDQNYISRFKSISISFLRYLLMRPLTEKQKQVLCLIEWFLGIYYSDLSREENGIHFINKKKRGMEDERIHDREI